LLFKREEGKENIVEIPCDTKEFRRIIEENKIVVVDFWAKWCFPCIVYAPKRRILGPVSDKDLVRLVEEYL